MLFFVKRQHFGDRLYMAGETREANEGDVSHLIQSGILSPMEAKAEPPLQNKAEVAPSNKAATGRKGK